MNKEELEMIKQEHEYFNKNMDDIIEYLKMIEQHEAASKIQEIKDNANKQAEIWLDEER